MSNGADLTEVAQQQPMQTTAVRWARAAPTRGRFDAASAGSGWQRANPRKEAHSMPMGQERTKEQLYREAKRLGIKGRSKMNKGQLKAALSRRGY
jgi:hypothetical protein